MSRAALTRELIVETSIRVIEAEGAERFTLRRLGEALVADPTAIYRHFRDKDELLRAVGDRVIAGITADLLDGGPAAWRPAVTEVCLRLRHAHITQPHLAAFTRSGPPLQPNEFGVTEVLLRELRRAGLTPGEATLAYHALIELTVGSGAQDAATEAMGSDAREHLYDGWRRAYATLDRAVYPASVELADELYRGSPEERFRSALELLLDGIEARAGAGGES